MSKTCKDQLSVLEIQNDGPAPVGLVASTGLLGKISLNWIPYQGAERYSIYRDGDLIATNILDNSFTDYPPEDNVVYQYQVQALIDSCGSNLSEPADGLTDPNGYTFYTTFIAIDTQEIRFYIDADTCEVDWGDGTWISYGSTIVQGSPTAQGVTCKIKSQFSDWDKTGPELIRFYPSNPDNGHPNDYKEITIVYGDSLLYADQMCEDLSVLEKFYWLGHCQCKDFDNTWANCESLTTHNFGEIDFSKGESFNYTWANCKSLTSFPIINLSNTTSLKETWYGCEGLTDFPEIEIGHITNLESTWAFCTGLTSFPFLNTSSVERFYKTWEGCSAIQKFPIIDFSNATLLMGTWEDCSRLDEYIQVNKDIHQLSVQNVETFTAAWAGCTSFANFPVINVSKGKRFDYTWYNTGIVEFPELTFQEARDFQGTFANSKNLMAITSNIGNESSYNFPLTFYGCDHLECISGINTTGVDFGDPYAVSGMFDGCVKLIRPNEDERTQLTADPGLNWVNNSSCPIIKDIYSKIEVVDVNSPIQLYVSAPFTYINDGVSTELPAGEHTLQASVNDPFIVIESIEQVDDLYFSTSDQGANDNYKSILLISEHLQDLSSFCQNLTNLEMVECGFPATLTNLSNAFSDCSSLTSLIIEGTTSNVQDWSGLVKSCSSLTNVSELDVSGGTNFTEMFKDCSSINHLGSFDTQSASDGFDMMFMGCPVLECFNEINTQGITRPVVDMFTGCDLLQAPDPSEQEVIADSGYHWVNTDNCPSGVPYPPTNVTASNNRWDGVLVQWETPITGADYYNIYRDSTVINTVNDPTLEYLDTTAQEGVVYIYYVTAGNDEGESNTSNTAQGNIIIPEYDQDLGFTSSNMNDFQHLYKTYVTDPGELSGGTKC